MGLSLKKYKKKLRKLKAKGLLPAYMSLPSVYNPKKNTKNGKKKVRKGILSGKDALNYLEDGHDNWYTREEWFTEKPLKWAQNLEIVFDKPVYERMAKYCLLATSEVSGFAKVDYSKPKDTKRVKKLITARVTDIALLHQVCTAGSTIIDEDGFVRWMTDLVRKEKDLSQWCLWWHTHYNFGTFWSPTDNDNITRLLDKFNLTLFSVCTNQFQQDIGRVDAIEDGEQKTAHVKVICRYLHDEKETACIKKELKEKVKRQKFVPTETKKGDKEEDKIQDEQAIYDPLHTSYHYRVNQFGFSGWAQRQKEARDKSSRAPYIITSKTKNKYNGLCRFIW